MNIAETRRECSELGLELNDGELLANPQGVVEELEKIFKTKTRDQWTELFRGERRDCSCSSENLLQTAMRV
jgi:hypothetical protein